MNPTHPTAPASMATHTPSWHRIVSVIVAEYYGTPETAERELRVRAAHPQSQRDQKSAMMDDVPKDAAKVLRLISTNKELISAMQYLLGSLDEAGLKPAGITQARAALNAAQE